MLRVLTMPCEDKGKLLAMPRTVLRKSRARGRFAALGLFFVVGCTVLAGAFLATPDPRGVGTHEQLWLTPCATHALLGIPCPFCGMTTAFVLMTQLRVADSFTCQPAGALIALGWVLFGVLGAVSAVTGRHLEVALFPGQVLWGLSVFCALILGAWLYKMGAVMT